MKSHYKGGGEERKRELKTLQGIEELRKEQKLLAERIEINKRPNTRFKAKCIRKLRNQWNRFRQTVNPSVFVLTLQVIFCLSVVTDTARGVESFMNPFAA